LRDYKETQKLELLSSFMQELENHLPIKDEYKNHKVGTAPPIVVVSLAYSGGDVAGPQTVAFNLPNDERVVKAKGSKMVMLKNISHVKFEKIISPIAQVVLDPDQVDLVSFDAFFTHTLCHEVMHGLGPHSIDLENNHKTTVRRELQEHHSTIEEAKADITGLWALNYLMEKGAFEKKLEKHYYVTFLVGAFRSIRFGEDAHGRGQALQLNYLLQQGGFEFNSEKGTYRVNFEKIKPAVEKLTAEILNLQAVGSKDRAIYLLDNFANLHASTKETLKRLESIPVDIHPLYSVEQSL